jgi:phosphoglycerate dehydrogenase-like enzyme
VRRRKLMIYFKDQPDLAIDKVQIDLSKEPIAIYTKDTKLTRKEVEKYKYILCPCTNFRHLVPCGYNKVIYLDDKKWLYTHIFSTMEHSLAILLNLIRTNRAELRGQHIGIIGYGRIAQQLAPILIDSFGCTLHVIDPNPVIYGREYPNSVVIFHDDIKNVTDKAIILMLASEQKDKKPILTADSFPDDKQKILINPARSSLVDESAVRHVLDNGGWYATDTIDDYNISFTDELMHNDRTIITPHIAGKSIISRILTDMYVIDKFIKTLEKNA